MKKETLGEEAEKYVNSFEFGIAHPRRVCINAFINGAKWKMDKQDEFAIGFAEWRNSLYVATDYKNLSTKELLEIYKKESNL
jgi:hypothetical protein